MFGTTLDIDDDDAASNERDNCRNVVKSSTAVTLHVVSEQIVMYSMMPENVLGVLMQSNTTRFPDTVTS